MTAGSLTIVIPTYNRHGPLRRALASAVAQQIPEGLAVDILVVDNSQDGNAFGIVEEFRAQGVGVAYASEREAGVANARNAGVQQSRGEWIAFLDDDEEAEPGWIAAHWRVIGMTGAEAVFGPVSAQAEEPGGLVALLPNFARRIELPDGADLAPHAALLGTNNSAFSRACLTGPEPFDRSLNGCGGEDSLLIKRLVFSGRKLRWSAEGCVTEWVPPRRLSWSYVTRRRFLSGQIRSFVLTMLESPRWGELAMWMAIGAGQLVVGGTLAGLYWFIDRPKALAARASAAAGLGKIFWMRAFRPGLYGKGLVS
ncbi:glycosyltransferase [Ancylobacter sp. A5.8]|uniref:glycosyltransferase family 2 protein n=1 Tax=Ancylobacter gelatini TaxID=2919920 RepID=UPI001F4EC21F|nr:glycosyltransferase family 2 protein [Ancylobacter gelatini]MCJ8141353.1 glycosyltransferase [Ancylobacter gelatini]